MQGERLPQNRGAEAMLTREQRLSERYRGQRMIYMRGYRRRQRTAELKAQQWQRAIDLICDDMETTDAARVLLDVKRITAMAARLKLRMVAAA
jgi:hypothetical protein